jgi:outer membrane biogenesis lipoprotein LolB
MSLADLVPIATACAFTAERRQTPQDSRAIWREKNRDKIRAYTKAWRAARKAKQ